MKTLILNTLIVTSGALLCALASAQNSSLPPVFGSINLNAGFLPDPVVIDVNAGGPVSASSVSGCNGYVSSAPSFRLYYSSGSSPLSIYTDADFDTTIMILTPGGEWLCDDDHPDLENLNGGWRIDSPGTGNYYVWVGSYSESNVNRQARLAFSEYMESSWENGLTANRTGFAIPELSLSSGFFPNTLTYQVTAGGNSPASGLNSSCSGYVGTSPTYRLNYSAGSQGLGMYLISDIDTTIAVRAPNGSWSCSDDAVGLDAGVYFNGPQSGNYDIYAGTYSEGNAGMLVNLAITSDPSGSWVSELSALNTVTPDLSLSGGFIPDPYTIDLTAGGSVDADDFDEVCSGYLPGSPSYVLNYSPGSLGLGFYLISDVDTTIAVRAPDGLWYCDDDHPDLGLDAGYYFASPQAGNYQIYVGTFGEGSVGSPATLAITEYSEGSWGPEDTLPPVPDAEIQFDSKL